MTKTRVWIATLLALALVATACGGDDADEPTATVAPTTTAADAMEETTTAAEEEMTTTTAEEVTTTTVLTGEELMAGSCAPPPEVAPPRGVEPVDGLTIIKAFSGDVPNIDPRLNFEARGSELAGNMYDQLITFHLEENADGVLVADSSRPQGLLAENWEFNEDCTSVTFTLRQGVKSPTQSGREVQPHRERDDRRRREVEFPESSLAPGPRGRLVRSCGDWPV